MRKYNKILLLIFAGILLVTSTTAAGPTNEKPLYDAAIKAVNISADNDAVFEYFLKQRPAPLTPERRAFYKKQLFGRKDLADTRIYDSNTKQALAVLEIIRPVLARYRWENAIDVVVLDQKAPFSGLYRESIFIITTSVLKTLSSDEIRASVAHELAHECFIEELIAADRAQDVGAHHLIEYKCDLIAALALQSLKQDPFTLIKAIARIEQYYQDNADTKLDTSGHPQSPDRKKCLQEFFSLRSSNAQAKN
jgi:hypothetical protein